MALILPPRGAFPRSPLIYPASVAPGFDPTHVASKGMSPGRGFSVVPMPGAQWLNLLTGRSGTPPGTQQATYTIGPLGPATSSVWGNQGGISFSGNAVPAANANATLAGIVQFVTGLGSADFATIAVNGPLTSTNGGIGLQVRGTGSNAGNFTANIFGADFSLGISPNIGGLYFVSFSIAPATGWNIVVVDFNTGKIQTNSFVGSVSVPAGNGTYWVGNDGAASPSFDLWHGLLFKAMYAPNYMTLSQQLQWAAAPFDFWHPRTQPYALLSKAPSGGITGTLAATQANQTLAAAGTVLVGATLNVTQANQTLVAAGGATVSGTLSRTQANQTLVATGGPVAGAALNLTQANQTIAAQGGGIVGATLNLSQAAQTLTGAGSVVTGIAGGLNLTQANQTLVAAGAVPAVATLNVTQANQTLSAAGNVPLTGLIATLNVIQASQILVGAAQGPVSAYRFNRMRSPVGARVGTRQQDDSL